VANIYHTDAGSGLDTNSGSSEGSAKETGVGAATTASNATVDLSADAPVDLSDVTINVDTIRLNGRTDGIRSTDIFLITAKDDGLDTVDVSPVPDSTTSSVTWAIGGAWLTLAKPLLVVEVGVKVNVKAGTSYNETANISLIGSVTAPIVFEGYTTTIGDGGIITIDGQSTRASGITDSTSGSTRYVFKNFRITGHTAVGVDMPTANTLVWKNCRFDNNGSIGGVDVNDFTLFEDCDFDNNTGSGVTTGEKTVFIGCRAFDNTVRGFSMEAGTCVHCVAWGNTNGQFYSPGTLGPNIFVNCTVDGEGGGATTGFEVVNNIEAIVVNCIIHDNNIGMDVGDIGELLVSRNNLLNSNTTRYAGGGQTFTGEVLAVPGFQDEVAHDYRLIASSAAINAGFDANQVQGQNSAVDLGAQQREALGGGGGANKILTGGGM